MQRISSDPRCLCSKMLQSHIHIMRFSNYNDNLMMVAISNVAEFCLSLERTVGQSFKKEKTEKTVENDGTNLIKLKNSALVLSDLLNAPNIAEVIVAEPGF
jgi:hypothetical protein